MGKESDGYIRSDAMPRSTIRKIMEQRINSSSLFICLCICFLLQLIYFFFVCLCVHLFIYNNFDI